MLTIISGFIGIAQERAKGNLCPVSSRGVEKSCRSAAPHRVILCTFIHSVSQVGAIIAGSYNSYLVVLKYLLHIMQNKPAAGLKPRLYRKLKKRLDGNYLKTCI
jgi:hypothetical protein